MQKQRNDGWIEAFEETWTINASVGQTLARTVRVECGRRYRVEPLNPQSKRLRGRVGTLVAVNQAFNPERGELLQDVPRRRVRVDLSDLVELSAEAFIDDMFDLAAHLGCLPEIPDADPKKLSEDECAALVHEQIEAVGRAISESKHPQARQRLQELLERHGKWPAR